VLILYYLLAFVFGAVIGSFLNVVIDRLPSGQSLIKPQSHCSVCQTKLKVKDLIPVISYLWLRGKCRYCRTHIPLRVLMVELVTGLLFVVLFWKYNLSPALSVVALYTCAFVAITVIDLENGIIPNSITYPLMIVSIILATFMGSVITNNIFVIDFFHWRATLPFLANLFESITGGLLAFILLLLIALISRGGMGLGDVKLAALIGFMTGFPLVIISIFVSIIAGGIVAVILLISRRKTRKDSVPFGPFLCLGAFIALLWGSNIISWYLGF
jgi:leader peptidase (prepilin peptidase)/N-methyltransferase